MTLYPGDRLSDEAVDSPSRPPFDRLLAPFSYPCLYFIASLLGVVVLQTFVPTPRIGVDTLWEPQLRLIVGLVAIAPAMFDMMFFTRRCCRRNIGPRFPPKQVFLAAVTGGMLALLVAWSLGAQLTLGLAALAFTVTVMWIWVSGVLAAYFAGAVWHLRQQRRMEWEQGLL